MNDVKCENTTILGTDPFPTICYTGIAVKPNDERCEMRKYYNTRNRPVSDPFPFLHQNQGRGFRRQERDEFSRQRGGRGGWRHDRFAARQRNRHCVGSLKVKSTGALDKWETQSCKITGARGVHDLYLKFFGNGTPLLNLDWWKFE
jgi:hypothetical protein